MNGMAFGPYSMTPGLPGFGSLVVFHGLRPTPTREGSRNKFCRLYVCTPRVHFGPLGAADPTPGACLTSPALTDCQIDG